jgi:hypothetical protein
MRAHDRRFISTYLSYLTHPGWSAVWRDSGNDRIDNSIRYRSTAKDSLRNRRAVIQTGGLVLLPPELTGILVSMKVHRIAVGELASTNRSWSLELTTERVSSRVTEWIEKFASSLDILRQGRDVPR